MSPELWAQFGLGGLTVGACGFLVWRIVERVLDRRLAPLVSVPADASAEGAPFMSRLACQVDPLHFQNAKDTAETVRDWDDKVQRGEFSCAWRDRDEVRDFLEELRATRAATETLTRELATLTTELRTTRNGRAGP